MKILAIESEVPGIPLAPYPGFSRLFAEET